MAFMCPAMGLALLGHLTIFIAQASASSHTRSSLAWILGGIDEDCDSACAQSGRQCDEKAWPTTFAEWKAVAALTQGLNCTSHSRGTWDHNPALCTEVGYCDGMCFWEGAGARCGGGTRQFPSLIARRICPCRAAGESQQAAGVSPAVAAAQAGSVQLPLPRTPVLAAVADAKHGRFWLPRAGNGTAAAGSRPAARKAGPRLGAAGGGAVVGGVRSAPPGRGGCQERECWPVRAGVSALRGLTLSARRALRGQQGMYIRRRLQSGGQQHMCMCPRLQMMWLRQAVVCDPRRWGFGGTTFPSLGLLGARRRTLPRSLSAP
ncbi:unnamed protein product [Prorocentrum cordatum]|uniref:Uncharacterized protein n=1 Tax=Prorocentrum cordatum TaxID=2364126 RepID=A0ABN9VGY3_9DINO|nr:unnamed protein product [Polarella glacialis]